MNTDYDVIIYGASGYTGKQIAWKLAERNIPFVAAGRNQSRLEEQMAETPELAGHDYCCREVPHDEAALTDLFEGAKVVYNVVGPFMQLGEPVVRACLNADCHYLDTTGEQDWMLFVEREYAEAFATKSLLLTPACSFMWAAGNIAAEICLETEGIDSLDLIYHAGGTPSVASSQSFVRMSCQPQYYLERGELVAWPPATAYDVAIPGIHQIQRTLPWGGGGEPVWYHQDERISNCQVLTALNRQIVDHVVSLMTEFEQKYRDAPREEQEAATNAWGNAIIDYEPPRQDPDTDRVFLSCQARGRTVARRVTFPTACGYTQTAIIAAAAVQRILEGRLKETGFVSPARAFGARYLIEAMADEGYHCQVENSI